MRLIFDCCKWDMQSEDHSVVADYPLFLEEQEWCRVAKLAEQLSEEVLAAEEELLHRPDLHATLGMPASIRKALLKLSAETIPTGGARIMRFDFHFTREGWRISEVNADVPGGFIEASGFNRLMGEHYSSHLIPPDPVDAYATKIACMTQRPGVVGLVHATAHCDDRQVMQYMGQEFERSGIRTVAISPNHLQWESGFARLTKPFPTVQPAVLVRFFPGEWLPNLHPACWLPWFRDGKTPMSNPGTAILIQSKLFPLVWDELKTCLSTWRSLLLETRSPSAAPKNSAEWIFKPVFGRVGEDVVIAGVTEQSAYKELIRDVARHPDDWIAQRRFESIPLETGSGLQHACLGVFTLDSRAVGAYGRIARKPLIDQDAQDIAVLVRRKDHGDDRKRPL